MKKRFVFSPHTADILIKVYGGSLKELFISAALGMFSRMVEKKKNRPGAVPKEINVKLHEEDLEGLLQSWLSELLFLFETKNLVLSRIKSLEFDGMSLSACVLFDVFDEGYYEKKDEIKAVTHHELKVEKTRTGWKSEIIFDV